MSAQVIFLNRLYYPDHEEMMRLENMQDYLTFCNIKYTQDNRTTDEKIKYAQKKEVHKRARERIHIVPDQF
jgi:hypothetical protein